MEGVCFVIVGGDVRATQYRAGSRAVHILTAPLTLGAGTDNRVQSLQLCQITLNTVHIL